MFFGLWLLYTLCTLLTLLAFLALVPPCSESGQILHLTEPLFTRPLSFATVGTALAVVGTLAVQAVNLQATLGAQTLNHADKFYAQRNMYLCMFTLFSLFVLWRLHTYRRPKRS
eukprot:m51a1_g14161 hypothetical protein (114) ;mRNA; r:66316-66822